MKKTYLFTAVAAGLISGSISAQTIATVNGTKIDSKEIDAQVKLIESQSNGRVKDSAALRTDLTQRKITSTIIAQEAKRLKIDESAEYKQALAQSREEARKQGLDKKSGFNQEWSDYQTELLNRAYIAQIAQSNPVTEADLTQAYKDFSSFYKGTDEVQLGEIFTNNSDNANKAISELKAKKNFQAVARKYSMAPQVQQTGGISPNYIPLKDLQQSMPSVYAAVSSLKKGGFTSPVRDNNNIYGIFYVNDKRAIKVPSYEEAKPQLAQQLQSVRINAALQSLFQKADIKPAK